MSQPGTMQLQVSRTTLETCYSIKYYGKPQRLQSQVLTYSSPFNAGPNTHKHTADKSHKIR